jgi:hypothetical protein
MTVPAFRIAGLNPYVSNAVYSHPIFFDGAAVEKHGLSIKKALLSDL